MSEKTDAEWQALDVRIAQDIMGCLLWDELSEDALKIYWKTMDERPTQVFLAHNRKYWWFLDESGCPDSTESLKSWQPHNDVAQALLALRNLLVRIGRYATAKLYMSTSPDRYHVTIHNWVSTSNIPTLFIQAPCAENIAPAVCMSIEKFMEDNC